MTWWEERTVSNPGGWEKLKILSGVVAAVLLAVGILQAKPTDAQDTRYNLQKLIDCFHELGYEIRGDDYLDLRDSVRAAIRKLLLAGGVIAESNFHLETYHDPKGNFRLDKSYGTESSREVNEVLAKECPAAIVER